MIRAAAMLVGHIGWPERQRKLEAALDICGRYEKKLTMTGRSTGCTGHDYAQYLMATLTGDVEARLKEYQARRSTRRGRGGFQPPSYGGKMPPLPAVPRGAGRRARHSFRYWRRPAAGQNSGACVLPRGRTADDVSRFLMRMGISLNSAGRFPRTILCGFLLRRGGSLLDIALRHRHAVEVCFTRLSLSVAFGGIDEVVRSKAP